MLRDYRCEPDGRVSGEVTGREHKLGARPGQHLNVHPTSSPVPNSWMWGPIPSRLSACIPLSTMRIALNAVAVLALLVGCVWFLQGINVLPGSFMTGQTKWAIYGALLVLAALVVLVFANRRRRRVT